MTQPLSPLYDREELIIAITRLEERQKAHDNLMVDGFVRIRVDLSEINSSVKAIESRESKLNDSINSLIRYREENEQRNNEHLIRHKEIEEKQTNAIELLNKLITPVLEGIKENKIRRLVWGQIWAGIVAGAAFVSVVVGIIVSLGLL